MNPSSTPPNPITGYAPVNGLQMYYEVHGSGAPVVLLHGSYMTISNNFNWTAWIGELAKARQVIAVEMQGHGRTADIQRDFSYETLADDVAALLDHLQLPSADLIGYSMGGGVALQCAIRHPAKVRKVVSISAVFCHDGWVQEVLDAYPHFTAEAFKGSPIEAAYTQLSPTPDQFPAFVKRVITMDLAPYDFGTDNLKATRAPVLFIHGDADGVRLDHIAEMFRLKGDEIMGDMRPRSASRLAILPDTTHVTLMERMPLIVPMVNDFFDAKPQDNFYKPTGCGRDDHRRTLDCYVRDVWKTNQRYRLNQQTGCTTPGFSVIITFTQATPIHTITKREIIVSSNIHFAMGGAIFGDFTAESVQLIAKYGLPGVEPYRGHLTAWLDKPQALKELLDQYGIRLITASNGGPGQSTEFIDRFKRAETVADHVAFCRDFLTVFGCTHFKINMGSRLAHETTLEEIKAIAETVTEIGKRTLEMGVTIAPHPHIWGPIERPEEVCALLDQTDPAIVSWIPDTAQLNLGGGDPVQLIADYYDRLAAVHWKDSKASYRGYTGPTPTKEMHAAEILYKDLGAGGVDHEAIWQMLQERGYNGWITLDLDPPRSNEGEGSVDDKIGINCRYLMERLQVPHF